MKVRTALIAAAMFTGLCSAGGASAHSDEYLDTQPSPHGGQIRMSGNHHFELVVAKGGKPGEDNPVMVYVTDHAGAKVSTAGAKGKVTILVGDAKTVVPLTPNGDNSLKGAGKYASAPDMKAVVSVTLAGEAAAQARFTPLARAATAKGGEHGGHAGHNKGH